MLFRSKTEEKFNELEDMCERGELEPEQAYELFKEFEDKMVSDCRQLMEAEPPTADELSEPDNKSVKLNDPPGAGPVLRWESTIVFAPGGDAWHPKNGKVKLSVIIKELGLSPQLSKFSDSADYSKDLHSYLKYCKDVIFPGIACSVEEKQVIENFQDMYKRREVMHPT